MLFRSHIRRSVVIVKELQSFVKRQPERVSHLHGRQLPLGETLKDIRLQKPARTRFVTRLTQFCGKLLRDLYGDCHLPRLYPNKPPHSKGIGARHPVGTSTENPAFFPGESDYHPATPFAQYAFHSDITAMVANSASVVGGSRSVEN